MQWDNPDWERQTFPYRRQLASADGPADLYRRRILAGLKAAGFRLVEPGGVNAPRGVSGLRREVFVVGEHLDQQGSWERVCAWLRTYNALPPVGFFIVSIVLFGMSLAQHLPLPIWMAPSVCLVFFGGVVYSYSSRPVTSTIAAVRIEPAPGYDAAESPRLVSIGNLMLARATSHADGRPGFRFLRGLDALGPPRMNDPCVQGLMRRLGVPE